MTGQTADSAVRADLTHVDTWLFDLDNTLYPLESGLAERVSARITDFVAALTGLPHPEARTLQKRYLAEHGLTLRGLMLHHDVLPDAYHAAVHDVSLDCLKPDDALRAALARLPGRRLIFTNADAGHAGRVLERLGLEGLFDEVFDIGAAGFTPKPDAAAFAAIISAHAIDPANAAFFDDWPNNLKPAADAGMTTVLVGMGAEACDLPFVSYRAPRLAQFLAAAKVKGEP